MALAAYCIERVLQHCFGQSKSWTPKHHFYIGLTTGILLEDGSNIEVEVSGGNYSRKIYQNYSAFWSHIDSGTMKNAGYIDWTASADWGDISGFFIADNSIIRESSGLIAVAALDTPKRILTNDVLALSPSGITITLT